MIHLLILTKNSDSLKVCFFATSKVIENRRSHEIFGTQNCTKIQEFDQKHKSGTCREKREGDRLVRPVSVTTNSVDSRTTSAGHIGVAVLAHVARRSCYSSYFMLETNFVFPGNFDVV